MFEVYITFIINQLLIDSEKLQFSYGWNVLLIPYFYWLMLFLLKYLILTLPIWAPINMILGNFNIVKYVNAVTSKK